MRTPTKTHRKMWFVINQKKSFFLACLTSLRNNWNEAKRLFNRFTCIIKVRLSYSRRAFRDDNKCNLSFCFIDI